MTDLPAGEAATDEMSVVARSPIHFGPFLVTPQVRLPEPLCPDPNNNIKA